MENQWMIIVEKLRIQPQTSRIYPGHGSCSAPTDSRRRNADRGPWTSWQGSPAPPGGLGGKSINRKGRSAVRGPWLAEERRPVVSAHALSFRRSRSHPGGSARPGMGGGREQEPGSCAMQLGACAAHPKMEPTPGTQATRPAAGLLPNSAPLRSRKSGAAPVKGTGGTSVEFGEIPFMILSLGPIKQRHGAAGQEQPSQRRPPEAAWWCHMTPARLRS